MDFEMKKRREKQFLNIFFGKDLFDRLLTPLIFLQQKT